MWHISNPTKIFDYIYSYDEDKEFQLIALMTKDKYEGLPLEDREALESLGIDEVDILDVWIKSPNNSIKLMKAKLLVFMI